VGVASGHASCARHCVNVWRHVRLLVLDTTCRRRHQGLERRTGRQQTIPEGQLVLSLAHDANAARPAQTGPQDPKRDNSPNVATRSKRLLRPRDRGISSDHEHGNVCVAQQLASDGPDVGPYLGGRSLAQGRTRPGVGDVRAQNRDIAGVATLGAALGAAEPTNARYTLRAVITRGSRAITTARSQPVSTTSTAASISGISEVNTGIGG
jgi:hypothetical protein